MLRGPKSLKKLCSVTHHWVLFWPSPSLLTAAYASNNTRTRICNRLRSPEMYSANLGIDSWAPYKVYKYGRYSIHVVLRSSSNLGGIGPFLYQSNAIFDNPVFFPNWADVQQKFPVAVNETSSSSLLPLCGGLSINLNLYLSSVPMFMGTPTHIIAIYWDFARFTLQWGVTKRQSRQ